MSVIAHLSVTALPAEGTSVGQYVRRAVQILQDSGLRHEVHAMGTEIECGRLDELFRVVQEIDEGLAKLGAERVMIQLKVDNRSDKPTSIEGKVRSALGQAPGRGGPKLGH